LYFFLIVNFCMNEEEKRICLNLVRPLKNKFQMLQEEV
jgi:hypothetical protein